MFRRIWIVPLLVFTTYNVQAQRQLNGIVVDQDTQKPLEGVAVAIEGKDKDTLTNALGSFHVLVNKSDILVFTKSSYISVKTKVPVSDDLQVSLKKRTVPEYLGGTEKFRKFFLENVKYPEDARKMGVEGTVYVSFDIDTLGQLNSIKLINDIGGGCGTEVAKVSRKLPKTWIPIDTRTLVILPLTFNLGGSKRTEPVKLPEGKLLDEIVITASGEKSIPSH